MTAILITGAASGIGRALALHLAVPGNILHLCDIAVPDLQSTTDACITKGARVYPKNLDVCDPEAMRTWLFASGPLDLVLICAGVQYTSLNGLPEAAAQITRTIAVNLNGALNTALPALEIMAAQPRRKDGTRGHIAILASQGAFVSVPGASAYTASKAALDNWAVGRAATARRAGIYITSICPGYVRTAMSAINGCAMHGLMEPEEAAIIICRKLKSRPVRLVFPWRMYLAARFGGLLPAGFPARVMAWNFARKNVSGEAQ